jgi:hypothetical protein
VGLPQTPAVQVVPVVQASPSSQESPSANFTSVGQAAEEPVHFSAGSQGPVEARQTVVAGL